MRKRKQIVAALVVSLGLTACSPEDAIYVTFGQNGENPQRETEARSVAYCESRMDPGAVSPTNDHGLFQINKPSYRKTAIAPKQIGMP